MELSELNLISERITPYLLKLEYDTILEKIESPMSVLNIAMNQVKQSAHFKSILNTLRSMGNRMNESRFVDKTNKIANRMRGQALGYDIEILTKIQNTKDVTGSGSLLDYLVQICLDNYKNIDTFEEEMRYIREAAYINIDNIDFDIRRFKSQYNGFFL